MTSALVILSGGQDSTTVLFWAKQRYDEIHALTFDYGQRHSIEIESAIKVANMAAADTHEVLRLPDDVLIGTSPLVNPREEVENYEGVGVLPGGLEKTFVPARNMLFLTVAANRAYVHGCDAICIGVGQEDFGGYPDCRCVFIDDMWRAINTGLFLVSEDRQLLVAAPLQHLSKRETVELALNLPGCMEALAYSHTCYQGQYPPAPYNHASLLRARGFHDAGVPDPLIVRAKNEGLLPDWWPNTGPISREHLEACCNA